MEIFHSFLYVLPEDIHHFCEQIMIFQRPTPRTAGLQSSHTTCRPHILAPRRMATCWTENEHEIDTQSTGMVLYPIFLAITRMSVYMYIYV